MPVGAVGELLVEGPLVARGYLNYPDTTSSPFVGCPAWRVAGLDGSCGPFYKTGDLVVSNSDGSFTFIGRKDSQVKIHGQRTELGEIEHYLYTSIKEMASLAVDMVTHPDVGGGQALATFFCPKHEEHGSSRQLLGLVTDATRSIMSRADAVLSRMLPNYMMPSLYVPLRYMPMTASGKVDRRLLRQLGKELSEIGRYQLATQKKRLPVTKMEKLLQSLWSQALGIAAEKIGADDTFFRLGGDSITAMKLVAIAGRENLWLTVAMVFETPQFSELAELLSVTAASLPLSSSHAVKPFELLGDPASIESIIRQAATQCDVTVDLVQDIYPCTALQQGLFASSVQQPGAYLFQNVYRLGPDIDLSRLKAAWQTVVKTTEVLRTRIIQTGSHDLFQAVLDEDLAWHSATVLEPCLEEARSWSAYAGGPLTRFTLVAEEAEDGDRYLVWTAHHALYDGWSLSLIIKRFLEVFETGSITESPPFTGYVKYLTEVDHTAAESFWRTALSDSRPTTFPQVPFPGYQSRVDSCEIAIVSWEPDIESKVFVPTCIRLAWSLVVGAYTGSDDVVIGATLSGRSAPVLGIADMIGPSITTLPLRAKLQPHLLIHELLDDLQKQSIEAIPFEHLGLQNIRRMLPPNEEATLDFHNLLVIQPQGHLQSLGSDIGMEKIDVTGDGFYTYPCIVECTLGEAQVHVNMRYDSRILSSAQTKNILHQFTFAMHQLLAKPSRETRLGDITLFSPEDRSQLWARNTEYPREMSACVHDVVGQQTRAQPEAPAICSHDGDLTYGELEAQATHLAFYLREVHQVKPEMLVPLCFEKSKWMVIAQLAVLKAGGVCLALDPSHPLEWWKNIVASTEAKVILTQSMLHGRLRNLTDQTIAIEDLDLSGPFARDYGDSFDRTVNPRNAAFVIYTSGTTSNPKGILLEHANICTSARAHGQALSIGSTSRYEVFWETYWSATNSFSHQGSCSTLPTLLMPVFRTISQP